MGALSEAICRAAQSLGVDVRTGCRVERIVTEQGRATAVALQGGERLEASVLVSNADPRTTFLELLEPRLLPASIVRAVKNIKFRGSAARIHLALRELPSFTAAKQADAAELLAGSIQIAPTMMYIQKAYDCVKYGEYSPNPYLDIQIPTLCDPDLAPEGRHTMSITAKYAPYQLRNQEWDEQRDVFSDIVLATLAEYAPGFQDLVMHRKTLLPVDLESRFGLPEGNGNHGEMTLDQFLHMRPIPGYARYATPVAGLYLCGAGTHPGGGVTGIPGRNAARAILKG
jgi:phytoene dehydrogenase-like protein